MANEDLINYITKARTAGLSDDRIQAALKDKNWQDEDIQEAFDSLSLDISEDTAEKKSAAPATKASPSGKMILKIETWSFVVIIISTILWMSWALLDIKFKYVTSTGIDKCQYLKDRQPGQAYCYKLEAARNNDAKACESITNYSARYSCLADTYINNNDVNSCDKIQAANKTNKNEVAPADSARARCKSRLAVKRNDIELCQSISAIDGRAGYRNQHDCFRDLALLRDDATLCGLIPDQKHDLSKYACYGFIATRLQDPSLCDDIPDQLVSDDEATSSDHLTQKNLMRIRQKCLDLKQPVPEYILEDLGLTP